MAPKPTPAPFERENRSGGLAGFGGAGFEGGGGGAGLGAAG